MQASSSELIHQFDEPARLAELHSIHLLDTPPDKFFDRYTHLIAEIFKVPMAAVILVDEHRQWIKSSVGLMMTETSLEDSFSVHALGMDVLEVPDTLEDDFFCNHPLVIGAPYIRFYMGVVLRGPTGQPLGTLCIMDTHSRYLTRVQRAWLITFGNLVNEIINNDHALSVAQLERQQKHQQNTLTGLSDEDQFNDILTHLLHVSEKHGHFLAVLYLHLNRSDEISRINGSQARDAVLNCLAERLMTPDTKILAAGHLSQSCFAAVIPLNSVRNLFDVVTPVISILASPITLEDTTILPDIDVGVSVSPLDGQSSLDLLERARISLDGPTSFEGVHVFSYEAEEASLRRHTIEQRLEPSLIGNCLIKHYQPLVTSDGSRIVGFEALARWNDSELGCVSPSEFVLVAEKNPKLSRLLTEWSLRTVCEKTKCWPLQMGEHALSIAVNIPAAQFYHEGFVRRILNTLEKYEMSPKHLTLELTEESLLANVDKVAKIMLDLRRHNIGMALDDFGTGYSSLSYLKNLPIDTLKIDKSFIDDLPNDTRAVDLVDGIIRIARGLGIRIVAEGVECEAQRALLHEVGCDVIQGYLFSRPLPENDALALLKSWPNSLRNF